MCNSKPCTRCTRPHWQSGRLCAECTDVEARQMNRGILDRNRAYQAGAGLDADEFFRPEEDKRSVDR